MAGLHTATLLAERGHDVLLVERRPSLTGAIRTTGIFVRRTLDDFPLPPEHLGPPIRLIRKSTVTRDTTTLIAICAAVLGLVKL